MENKIIKPTWMVHMVGDEDTPLTYHSHGLDEYDSLELEINLSIPQKLGMYIINTIGLRIANGEKFKDGDMVDEVVNCLLPIRETSGIHSNDKHLRIIIPDENFKFPWDEGCNLEYINQINDANLVN